LPARPTTHPRRRADIITAGIIGLGVFVLMTMWAVVAISIGAAREAAMARAHSIGRNLAIAFDTEVQRTLSDVVRSMDYFSERVRQSPRNFDLFTWARETPLLGPGVEASIISPDGQLASSTLAPVIQPVDLSDRDHFRVHLGAGDPGLYIGAAVLGRTSSRYILPVSRRISGLDGEFLGVLVFLITPDTLTRLHKTMDLGAHDVIALVGLDNVIRARFAGDSPNGTVGVGTRVAGDPEALPGTTEGFVIRQSPLDGVTRLYTYRRAGAFPLSVTVGLDVDTVLAFDHPSAAVDGGDRDAHSDRADGIYDARGQDPHRS